MLRVTRKRLIMVQGPLRHGLVPPNQVGSQLAMD